MPLSGFSTFRRIVWSALLAGTITGIVVTLLQGLTTAPLIAQAEEYERAVKHLDQGPADAAEAGHSHASSREVGSNHDRHPASPRAWEPEAGFERTAYTALATTLAAFGYALLLGAILSLLGATGLRAGLVLGATGFVVFQLAPALGLPPEPPGAPIAEVLPRQLWWLGTVVATSLGFACCYVARASKRGWLLAGIVLIAVPHLIGAPRGLVETSTVPDELVHRFAWMAILTAMCFWVALGALTGYFDQRLGTAAPRSVD